jgi:hypothetical protein
MVISSAFAGMPNDRTASELCQPKWPRRGQAAQRSELNETATVIKRASQPLAIWAIIAKSMAVRADRHDVIDYRF